VRRCALCPHPRIDMTRDRMPTTAGWAHACLGICKNHSQRRNIMCMPGLRYERGARRCISRLRQILTRWSRLTKQVVCGCRCPQLPIIDGYYSYRQCYRPSQRPTISKQTTDHGLTQNDRHWTTIRKNQQIAPRGVESNRFGVSIILSSGEGRKGSRSRTPHWSVSTFSGRSAGLDRVVRVYSSRSSKNSR
jgi:hypothetical protein